MNLLIMLFQILVIIIFLGLCIWNVVHGMGEGSLLIHDQFGMNGKAVVKYSAPINQITNGKNR